MADLVEGLKVVEQGVKTSYGLKDVKSLELVDFQCNDLEDRHAGTICKMISQ